MCAHVGAIGGVGGMGALAATGAPNVAVIVGFALGTIVVGACMVRSAVVLKRPAR